MNKSQVVDSIAAKTGLKKSQAEAALAAFVATVEEALKSEEKVQLVGFGTFAVKTRGARKGINPQTKKAIDIPASKYPAFTVGKAFKDSIQ